VLHVGIIKSALIVIHIAGSSVGFTGREFKGMALGSVPWAVGILFGKALH